MASIKDIARKDARDYAYAQMNYGDGAGNKRKLIKARVDTRKSNPVYAQAFNEERARINYEKVAKKVETRKDILAGLDVAKKTAKTTKRIYQAYDRNRDIFELAGQVIRRLLG